MYNGSTCEIYTDANGQPVTMLSAVQTLAPQAAAVLAVGTCASFGGTAAAMPNPTGAKGVSEVTGVSPINIPGCPPHPDWMVWTIATALTAPETITLDADRRPDFLYGSTVHSQCSRQNLAWSASLSDSGKCLNSLGCKGRLTHAGLSDPPMEQRG